MLPSFSTAWQGESLTSTSFTSTSHLRSSLTFATPVLTRSIDQLEPSQVPSQSPPVATFTAAATVFPAHVSPTGAPAGATGVPGSVTVVR